MLIQKDTLKSIIQSKGLESVEVYSFKFENFLRIDSEIEESFLDLAKGLGASFVFYSYLYYDIDDYLIDLDDEARLDYPKNFLKDIDEYNKQAMEVDFGKPFELVLIFNKDNIPVISIFRDNWIEDTFLHETQEQLDILEEKNDKEWRTYMDKVKHDIEKDKDEVAEILMSEEDFMLCKNKRSRELKLYEVLNRPENERFKYLLDEKDAFAFRDTAGFYLDKVWYTYKERNK